MGIGARLVLLLAGALWLGGCGLPAKQPARDWPAPSPALWEVTTASGAVRGWLLGTVHALPDGVAWRTDAIDRAFSQSDLLVVEIADLDNGSASRDAFDPISRRAGLPPLLERVPPSDRRALEAAIDRAGMTMGDFEDIKTWAAALLLASALREDNPANGVDRALLRDARQIVGLESFAEQYARFDSLSRSGQNLLLRSIVEEADGPARNDRIEAWLTGNTERLAKLSHDALLTDGELRRVLLTERNQIWTTRIADLVEQRRKPLVAVGAAHMLGKDGLPALLAARGFTVSRIE